MAPTAATSNKGARKTNAGSALTNSLAPKCGKAGAGGPIQGRWPRKPTGLPAASASAYNWAGCARTRFASAPISLVVYSPTEQISS